MGFFKHFNRGLKKTRDSVAGAIDAALQDKVEVDDEFYDDLEEILIMADVGMKTSLEIVDELRDAVRSKKLRWTKKRFRILSPKSFRAAIWIL